MGDRLLLSVEDMRVSFPGPGAEAPVVDGVSFNLFEGETVALVGESGSGKTLTGKALMGLLPRRARVSGGRAVLWHEGREIDLLGRKPEALRPLRGRVVSMIFQEPMSALSPLHRVGEQVAEVLAVHGIDGNRRARVLEVFREVGFPDPERAWRAYPFELSGGLRQRAMIAMAVVANPKLVIADEPTTALDVTTQAMVLDLLERLQRSHGLAVLLITHDLGIVANMAERMVVLKRGRVVEAGATAEVLRAPGHPYTRRLIAAAPKIPEKLPHPPWGGGDVILRAERLSKTYPGRARLLGRAGPPIRAVDDVSLAIERGRTLALVGESGSGKSTVARLLLRAEPADPGALIRFRSRDGAELDVTRISGEELKRFRRCAQMIFQDPYGALSPRMSVQDIVTEPLAIHGIGTPAERRERAAYLLRRVGLSPDHLGRFPYAFSGGQRQRIAIARALALEPELLVCDEPTSALDVSVQAEVLALLRELREDFGLSYLFISHDLAVVAQLADWVMVMRRGRVLEEGTADAVFGDPRHPYTAALIAAHPEPEVGRHVDFAAVARGAGEPETWPPPFRFEGDRAPPLVEVGPGHRVRLAA